MAKPTIAQIRRTLRSYATAHKKLRAIYKSGLSNAALLQLAQACLTKPAKKATRKPAAKKAAVPKAVDSGVVTTPEPAATKLIASEPAPIGAFQHPKRPSLFRAVCLVMGEKNMTAKQVLEELTARNWMPLSTRPQAYIATYLQRNRYAFERVPAPGSAVFRVKRKYILVEEAA